VQPCTPDLEAIVRENFSRQGALKIFSAELLSVGPGQCRIRIPYSERVTQHLGYFHGGVIGLAADVAGGMAALSLCEAGVEVLSVEYKINFLAPARGVAIVAAAQVVRSGRTLLVTRMEVNSIDADGNAHACAMATQTIMAVPAERVRR
jgi:uncharacterized protein (TIGR00369 family)